VFALAESSVDLLVQCYTNSTDYGEFLEAKEALALSILEIVEEEGGEIAFPSRSIYISENDSAEKPG
jgi:MscS family membrane protein